jgi:hypothetical protein
MVLVLLYAVAHINLMKHFFCFTMSGSQASPTVTKPLDNRFRWRMAVLDTGIGDIVCVRSGLQALVSRALRVALFQPYQPNSEGTHKCNREHGRRVRIAWSITLIANDRTVQMFAAFPTAWLRPLRVYVFSLTACNLIWEALQLPLYTVWSTASMGELFYDVLHCTVGDTMIASLALFSSILIAGSVTSPRARFTAISVLTVLFGLGYTIYSEWHNTVTTHAWSYAPSMPTLLGIGVAPVAQWVVVPVLAFRLMQRLLHQPG